MDRFESRVDRVTYMLTRDEVEKAILAYAINLAGMKFDATTQISLTDCGATITTEFFVGGSVP